MADLTTQDWTNLFSGGLNTLGSMAGANQLASTAAQQAQASQFRPVGVTTRFGKSGFQYDDQGRLTGAGYQVAPDVAAMREGLLGLAGTGLTQAQQAQAYQPTVTAAGQGLFNLGQQYLAQSPEAAAQDWMSKQQALLAPGREQELASLQNKLFQQGRTGLATGATSAGYAPGAAGLAATNPEMAAYYNAIAKQDAALAAGAQQAGMEQTKFGQGLLGSGLDLTKAGYGLQTSALNPYTQYVSGATGLEDQALKAMTQGASLGGTASNAAAEAARIQAQGQNAITNALTKSVSGLTDPISQLIAGLTSSSGSSNLGSFVSDPNAYAFGSNWWE